MKIRIVKLGGSLLLRPDLIGDFQSWCARNKEDGCLTLILVGGGEMINAVRGWDALRPGDPVDVHWRCVEMLRFSFESMREALEAGGCGERFEAIATREQWREFADGVLPSFSQDPPLGSRLILVNVPAFYEPATIRDSAFRLPENWQTTTDAIALWLADHVSVILNDASRRLGAAKGRFSVDCTLLKFCTPPIGWTLESLVEAEIIDSACLVFADSPVELKVERLPA